MQIDGHIQALREDLVRVAALGDEATSRAADLLSVAIEASLARRIQDVLAEAALDLSAQLESEGAHVEVRIAGRDPELVLVREDGSVPEPVDEAFSARITLRLPESLKQRIESAAGREGASVNTWLVQALQRSVEPRTRSTTSGSRNRLTGYGRS
jgi:predicted DNA binding CopG/RHH family protein